MICFYHRADMDGKCSAKIVQMKYPGIRLIGLDYPDEKKAEDLIDEYKLTKDTQVFMVDFSLQPFTEMEILSHNCMLTWIDHHKTAIEEYEKSRGLYPGGLNKDFYPSGLHIDINHNNDNPKNKSAACDLCWEYFYPNTDPPLVVYLSGRYDIWDHSDNRVLPFQYGIRQFDTSIDNNTVWDKLFNDDYLYIEKIIGIGRCILEYQKIQDEIYCKTYGREIMFEGYKTFIINKGLANSFLFDFIKEQNLGYDLYIAYVQMRNGRWKFSVFSTTIDGSAISKKYGGGGHPGASGFQLDTLPDGF